MKVFRDITNLPAFNNGVVTIGTFDGVHTGHQEIIKRINQSAQNIEGESIILTFHPHPRLVLHPEDKSLKLINTLDEKIALLDWYGTDNLIIAPFTLEFSQLSAEAYVKEFLWKLIHPGKVVIGYNHHFGNDRAGDIQLIREMGNQLGFEVEEIEKQMVDQIAVSSTKIRNALAEGDIDAANSLLGHNFSMRGKVVEGHRRGQELGFPTANLEIDNPNKLIPANGVFAVRILLGGVEHSGMLNIGFRPTFDGSDQTMEVHIFDFNHDIYGTEIDIEFIAPIRKEMKFDSAEDLIEQLGKDRDVSKKILSN